MCSVSISVLNLDRIHLPTDFLKLLGTLVANHKEVRILNEPLGHAQACHLSLSSFLNQVERISLSGTDLNDEKAAIIAKFLEFAPGLVSLNLSSNRITSKGVAQLADVCLTHIDDAMLPSNFVTTQTLANHKRIKVLKLSKNEIDDEGFQRLAAVFRSNSDLEQVSLSRNKITGTLLNYVQECSFQDSQTPCRRSGILHGCCTSILWSEQALHSLTKSQPAW